MLRNEKCDFVTRSVVTPSNLCEVSRCDEKGCFATRRVTSSREALFKTFEKCDFVTISVALRREGLLRNEKCDFVTRSVVTSLDPSVGYADSSRWLCQHFSQALPALPAVSLRRSSQMFFAFSPVSPDLLAASLRRTSRHVPCHFSSHLFTALFGMFLATSRRFHLLFSQAPPALLVGSSDKVLLKIAYLDR